MLQSVHAGKTAVFVSVMVTTVTHAKHERFLLLTFSAFSESCFPVFVVLAKRHRRIPNGRLNGLHGECGQVAEVCIQFKSVLNTMETFRGKTVIIPRSRDWKVIDETDKYSGEQRKQCSIATGKECTLYPFPAGMEVLKMFKPKKWLDPTAGWGDRLRCAIEYGCEYTGVDSNKEMKSAYAAIIKDKATNPEKYKIKIGKFQDVRITGKYDLVFTSPPFFTKELYEHMVQWKDVSEFMDEFLKPLFKKSFEHLEDGGHIVLYIEDKGVDGFIDLMKLFVEADLPKLKYEGAFYYQGSKAMRPYYVWVKRKT